MSLYVVTCFCACVFVHMCVRQICRGHTGMLATMLVFSVWSGLWDYTHGLSLSFFSLSVHMNTRTCSLISSARVSEDLSTVYIVLLPSNNKEWECNSKINHWTEINHKNSQDLKLSHRGSTNMSQIDSSFTSFSSCSINYFFLCVSFSPYLTSQPISYIWELLLLFCPSQWDREQCNAASSAMWDTLQHSVMEHRLRQGHAGSSQYVEGGWLRCTELNIDSRSRWGQRSPHSFILCGHVLQPRDWDTCCVPIPRYMVNSIQYVQMITVYCCCYDTKNTVLVLYCTVLLDWKSDLVAVSFSLRYSLWHRLCFKFLICSCQLFSVFSSEWRIDVIFTWHHFQSTRKLQYCLLGAGSLMFFTLRNYFNLKVVIFYKLRQPLAILWPFFCQPFFSGTGRRHHHSQSHLHSSGWISCLGNNRKWSQHQTYWNCWKDVNSDSEVWNEATLLFCAREK